MPDIPNFNMQNNFPISDVINAAQRKGALDNQTVLAQSQMIDNALSKIGEVGQSLYNRKLQMAQALSGAKMFAQTPEGQQMLAPTTTQSPAPIQPTITNGPMGRVTPAQTAAYDPTAGTVTPNQPAMQTTTTPSPISMGDLQTAFRGESPSNMLTQLFERQKQRQQFGLDQQKQAFTEKMEPIKLAQQAQLTQALTGVRGRQVSAEEANNIRAQKTALQTKLTGIIKEFPDLAGSIISGIVPTGLNQQEAAAVQDYQNTKNQIDDYDRQLNGGGVSTKDPKHMSTADLLALRAQIAAQGQ